MELLFETREFSFEGCLVEALGGGWEVDRLVVLVYRSDDSVAGSYYIENEWAQAYMDGRMTNIEYLNRFASTAQYS